MLRNKRAVSRRTLVVVIGAEAEAEVGWTHGLAWWGKVALVAPIKSYQNLSLKFLGQPRSSVVPASYTTNFATMGRKGFRVSNINTSTLLVSVSILSIDLSNMY